jgi:hypothetical protein
MQRLRRAGLRDISPGEVRIKGGKACDRHIGDDAGVTHKHARLHGDPGKTERIKDDTYGFAS